MVIRVASPSQLPVGNAPVPMPPGWNASESSSAGNSSQAHLESAHYSPRYESDRFLGRTADGTTRLRRRVRQTHPLSKADVNAQWAPPPEAVSPESVLTGQLLLEPTPELLGQVQAALVGLTLNRAAVKEIKKLQRERDVNSKTTLPPVPVPVPLPTSDESHEQHVDEAFGVAAPLSQAFNSEELDPSQSDHSAFAPKTIAPLPEVNPELEVVTNQQPQITAVAQPEPQSEPQSEPQPAELETEAVQLPTELELRATAGQETSATDSSESDAHNVQWQVRGDLAATPPTAVSPRKPVSEPDVLTELSEVVEMTVRTVSSYVPARSELKTPRRTVPLAPPTLEVVPSNRHERERARKAIHGRIKTVVDPHAPYQPSTQELQQIAGANSGNSALSAPGQPVAPIAPHKAGAANEIPASHTSVAPPVAPVVQSEALAPLNQTAVPVVQSEPQSSRGATTQQKTERQKRAERAAVEEKARQLTDPHSLTAQNLTGAKTHTVGTKSQHKRDRLSREEVVLKRLLTILCTVVFGAVVAVALQFYTLYGPLLTAERAAQQYLEFLEIGDVESAYELEQQTSGRTTISNATFVASESRPAHYDIVSVLEMKNQNIATVQWELDGQTYESELTLQRISTGLFGWVPQWVVRDGLMEPVTVTVSTIRGAGQAHTIHINNSRQDVRVRSGGNGTILELPPGKFEISAPYIGKLSDFGAARTVTVGGNDAREQRVNFSEAPTAALRTEARTEAQLFINECLSLLDGSNCPNKLEDSWVDPLQVTKFEWELQEPTYSMGADGTSLKLAGKFVLRYTYAPIPESNSTWVQPDPIMYAWETDFTQAWQVNVVGDRVVLDPN